MRLEPDPHRVDPLLQRLRADPTPRPLLTQTDPAERLAALLDERRPLYSQADLRVTQGDEPPEVVARRVIEALPTILRAPSVPPQGPITLADGAGQARASLN